MGTQKRTSMVGSPSGQSSYSPFAPAPDPPTDPNQRIDPPIPPTGGVDPHRAVDPEVPPPTVDPVNVSEETYVLAQHTPSLSPEQMKEQTIGAAPGLSGNLFGVAFLLWLAGFVGWCAALGGLCDLQDKIDVDGAASWWSTAGYPNLAPMAMYRLDWYLVFFQFVSLLVLLLALCFDSFRQDARISILGFLICCGALQAIAADHFANIHNKADGRTAKAAMVTFVGFALAALADYALLIFLGTDLGVS